MRYRGLLPFLPKEDLIFTANPMEALHREFERLADTTGLGALRELVPTIDVADGKDGLKVVVELAGVDEKDVKVIIAGDILTIKGEKKTDRDEKGANYHIVERVFGHFVRTIKLPYEIEKDKVDAKFAKGTLTITLPKTKVDKEAIKEIEVKIK